ncbi:MAG: glycosyltransferase [Gammaproteobacteria bacterium]|nr:glycosyltransferase [Gammaproteobacteria bacterium]
MKILFSVHGYKPAWRVGGPILSVSALAERLVSKGHQVIVCTTNMNLDQELDVPLNTPINIKGVEVYYFACEEYLKRYFSRIGYLSKSIGTLYSPTMGQALREFVPKVDIVHVHLPFVYPTMAAARAAFKFDKPLFYHQRGVFDPARLRFRSLKKNAYISLVERPILRRATTLIALTEAERESYRRLDVETPCAVIPNGIDLPELSVLTDSQVELLRSVGIEPSHKVVLFMGRLHPIKGADRLLDAFSRIAAEVPDAHLIMAGPDEFGIHQDFLYKTRELDLASRVSFPGMVEGDLKRALLLRANLFCLPSDAEGFSMAILEALSYAIPVMISPGCHFDEIEAAGAGWVVNADVPAMAKALRACLADIHHLRQHGMLGRRLVEQRYGWDTISEQILSAYEEGIARHASRQRT